ncbi:MarR family transcriptional regulator [Oricola sp.]|uniref:MarR family winged helix-turn-helix transcriptional regulator n=1 Tax=Oricola sp. TaxID=1979950 RepID=UPI0026010401|nr:MarR family transcriptional regulator [Oricola sp.]MCI5075107.1 MarR family transcriptional regulator [Oricola sp.]
MPEVHEMPGHLIRRLNQISVSVFSERMGQEGYDLTPVQFAAMSVLKLDPGIDQATLAGSIAYDRATIGGVLDRLQHKGLIERTVSRHDRRARALRLTAQGESVLDAVTPVVRDLQGDILAGLTPAEQDQFLALARKATEAGNTLSRAPLVNRGKRDADA